MKTTLVIMAAGMGSRFGGLKQMEPIGLHSEIIADYSVYDAKRAGFDKVIFIIKRELEDTFNKKIFNHIAKEIEAEYVFQDMEALPAGFLVPAGRTKPWGTGHAVLSCGNAIASTENFAVINADDYYGTETFSQLHKHLTNPANGPHTNHHCMVGFQLHNTISEHGTVSRGVCDVDANGLLIGIEEILKIEKVGNEIVYYKEDGSTQPLSLQTTISMSAWGFTPQFFTTLKSSFHSFLQARGTEMKSEFYLPKGVEDALKEKTTTVSVLPCQEKWYGVTYKEDTPVIRAAIKKMIADGKYPEKLWR